MKAAMPGTWIPATVVQTPNIGNHTPPRSYVVSTDQRGTYRINRKHLRKTTVPEQSYSNNSINETPVSEELPSNPSVSTHPPSISNTLSKPATHTPDGQYFKRAGGIANRCIITSDYFIISELFKVFKYYQ